MTPEEIISKFTERFGEGILSTEVLVREEGHLNKVEQKGIRMNVTRSVFHRVVALLKEFGPPHVACPMASKEYENEFDLIYPLTIFAGEGNFRELPVIITVTLPKDDLRIRTLTDLIPGILYMERETSEMLGVTIEDIPDNRRIFTPDNLPTGMTPLRREEV
ncbi:MAG: hypothetical protein GY754_18540 [bacterium]|nr:hypothetical protein [bacterium]